MSSQQFELAAIKLRKFSLGLGKLLFEYFQSIGTSTREQLKTLNECMNTSKFVTTHIVVAAVAHLR